jgi:hypothetical protein
MSKAGQFEFYYRTLSDEQLSWIACTAAHDLLPEALQALRAELRRRNLSDSVDRALAAQTRQWSES